MTTGKLISNAEGVTLEQQIAAAARELRLRENVYPKWIASGRMKEEAAQSEINAMAAILKTLEGLRAARTEGAGEEIPTDESPLKDVRAYLRKHANAGTTCPACKQRVEIYTRPFNRNYARNLRAVYIHHIQTGEEWIDVPALLAAQNLGRGNDGAQPARWGLLEPKDGTKGSGVYRLTPLGIAFVEGRTRIRKFIRVYNGRTLKCDDESTISFAEALGEPFRVEDIHAIKREGESINEEAADAKG